ncbi:hypothetical protein DPMN_137049 [Dreissena polymorpha]|uniref:Uncharacterized protein n=1 Tax=Dreissena polymorpha TaxID=45954 RepID=A0A9D4G221_DREPO|nr:hypothetical protein DPMN_137049 [Dreissena polymorpha]
MQLTTCDGQQHYPSVLGAGPELPFLWSLMRLPSFHSVGFFSFFLHLASSLRLF